MDYKKLRQCTAGLADILYSVDITSSTNTDARRLISEKPNADIILCTADMQTGGRGRQGKTFASPAGGLYMTVAMKTGLPLLSAVGATSCAAVALAHALETQGVSCGIKWVNDIYLNGAKLAGILTESVNDYKTMRSEYIIIGIGVNVAQVSFPHDVRAVSLEEAGYTVSPEELCADIVRELTKFRKNGFDFASCADEYRKLSTVLGREVMYIRDGVQYFGTAMTIDEHGGLTVRGEDGQTHTLDSGEITLRVKSTDDR